MNAGVGHDRGTPLCRHPPENPVTHPPVGTGVGGTPSHDATRPPVRLAPRYPARMPVDYSGQDLRGRDFSGQDLSLAVLTLANLRGANLTGASLTGGAARIMARGATYPRADRRVRACVFKRIDEVGLVT